MESALGSHHVLKGRSGVGDTERRENGQMALTQDQRTMERTLIRPISLHDVVKSNKGCWRIPSSLRGMFVSCSTTQRTSQAQISTGGKRSNSSTFRSEPPSY
jgi:hypothetical protein